MSNITEGLNDFACSCTRTQVGYQPGFVNQPGLKKKINLHRPGLPAVRPTRVRPGQLVLLLGRKTPFDIFAGIMEENGGQKANCCDVVRHLFFFVCFG